MNKLLYISIIFFSLNATSTDSFSQEAVKARISPLAIVTMKYEDSYVKITYSQPHKKGRNIFGGLEKFGEVWRTGANEATEITLTGDLIVQKDTLLAGTYSLFTIPNENEWTIIFNKQLGQWGAYNYHEPSDVLRVNVPTQKIKEFIYEPFTIVFEQKNEAANMLLMWDNIKVSIPITFID
jgi:hypothetical protein